MHAASLGDKAGAGAMVASAAQGSHASMSQWIPALAPQYPKIEHNADSCKMIIGHRFSLKNRWRTLKIYENTNTIYKQGTCRKWKKMFLCLMSHLHIIQSQHYLKIFINISNLTLTYPQYLPGALE